MDIDFSKIKMPNVLFLECCKTNGEKEYIEFIPSKIWYNYNKRFEDRAIYCHISNIATAEPRVNKLFSPDLQSINIINFQINNKIINIPVIFSECTKSIEGNLYILSFSFID